MKTLQKYTFVKRNFKKIKSSVRRSNVKSIIIMLGISFKNQFIISINNAIFSD